MDSWKYIFVRTVLYIRYVKRLVSVYRHVEEYLLTD
jgi:hypothetical protein